MPAHVVGQVALEAFIVQLDHSAVPVVVHSATFEILFPTLVIARVEPFLEGAVRSRRGRDVPVNGHGTRGGVANLHSELRAQSGHLTRGSSKDGECIQHHVRVGYAVVDGRQIGEGDSVDGDDLLGIDHRGNVHEGDQHLARGGA